MAVRSKRVKRVPTQETPKGEGAGVSQTVVLMREVDAPVQVQPSAEDELYSEGAGVAGTFDKKAETEEEMAETAEEMAETEEEAEEETEEETAETEEEAEAEETEEAEKEAEEEETEEAEKDVEEEAEEEETAETENADSTGLNLTEDMLDSIEKSYKKAIAGVTQRMTGTDTKVQKRDIGNEVKLLQAFSTLIENYPQSKLVRGEDGAGTFKIDVKEIMCDFVEMLFAIEKCRNLVERHQKKSGTVIYGFEVETLRALAIADVLQTEDELQQREQG